MKMAFMLRLHNSGSDQCCYAENA